MSFECALPFPTDSEDFVLGFECGRIWTLMTENPDILPGLIFHATNAEMVLRMIEAKEIDHLKAEFTDDEMWMRLVEKEVD